MMKLKKWLSAGLAAVLLAALFAGCTMLPNNQGTTAPAGTTAGSSQTTAKSSQTAATETTKAELKPVTLTWYIRNAEPKNFASVMDKINSELKEKLNTKLEIVCIEGAAWKDKIPVIMVAGDNMDLIWTASYGGFEYGLNVIKGAFLELDDLLAQYAPDLLKNYPEGLWNSLRIDGKLYAIPNYQKEFTQRGFMARKDLLDKYNIDADSMMTREGLLNALQIIKDNEKIYPLMGGGISAYYAGKELNDAGIFRGPGPEFRLIDTKNWKVLDFTENDPILEQHEFSRELYLRGFITPDALTIQNTTAEFKTKKYFMQPASYKPGADADYTNSNGFELVVRALDDAYIDDTSAQATLTSVLKASKNPDRAVMLLNLVNTDKEFYNTLIFGLEGQDYNKVGENRIERAQNSYMLPAWMMGNQFNAYLLPGQPDDLWEVTENLNRTARVNPLVGFAFDASSVMTETANVTSVTNEYKDILVNGMDDPVKVYNEMKEKSMQAGLDKILKEYQRQLDEWAVKNGKK